MPNMRIVSNNAADRGTTTASAQVGSFVVGNLKSDIKSSVWRVTGTSGTLQTTWNSFETVSCVILPFCNFTPTVVIRVRGYSDTAGTVQVVDSGVVLAAPSQQVALMGFTALAAQSAYAYGGGVCARVYIPTTSVKKVVIDITDTSNTAGYLEVSRLVIGEYWYPSINPPHGLSLTLQDTGKQLRTDGGDLLTDVGTRNKKLSLMLENLPVSDRNPLMSILRYSGVTGGVFISVYPEDTDLELERDYQIYGKFTSVPSNTLISFNAYQAPLEIEEV